MKKKNTENFTADERNWMDTLAVNFVVAQADGYQQGYAQAINDLTENIVDYWNSSDDKLQQSVLDILVDLGVELSKRQDVAKKNIEQAKEMGYEQYYRWSFKEPSRPFTTTVSLFTKDFEAEEEEQDADSN